MSFKKNGTTNFKSHNEVSPYFLMKTKLLDDGSAWARINYLDVTESEDYFDNDAEVLECTNKDNRFSLMKYVDEFRAKRLLPEGYRKLDYIESSGTQAIDTNYYWTKENIRIYLDAIVNTNAGNESLFGNEEYIDSGSTRYFAGIPHGKNGSYSIYLGTGGIGNIAVTLGERFVMDIRTTTAKSVSAYLNGALKFTTTYNGSVLTKANAYTSSSTATNVGTIFLFSNHNSNKGASMPGQTQTVGAMRVFAFKLYDGDVLVRDMMPCINNANVVGMYDLVEQKFYSNIGTGSFTAGNIIEEKYSDAGGPLEFMLTYPSLSPTLYNRWEQMISPNTVNRNNTTGIGYKAIHIDFTEYAGPLTFSGTRGSSMYSCNTSGNWWAPVGQLVGFSGGIPAADGSTQQSTELWVRIDTLSQNVINKILKETVLSSDKRARVLASQELEATEFIEM